MVENKHPAEIGVATKNYRVSLVPLSYDRWRFDF
jgi:hypothetical protein